MADMILQIEEKPVIEQVHEFLKGLTTQQQREFALMIHGAKMTMKLMDADHGDNQYENL